MEDRAFLQASSSLEHMWLCACHKSSHIHQLPEILYLVIRIFKILGDMAAEQALGLMPSYSRLHTMGLGDNGVEGIQQFCDQHQCNLICKALNLPDLHELLPTLFGNITNISAVKLVFDLSFDIKQALVRFPVSDGSESEGSSVIPPLDSHPELTQNQS